MNADKLSYFADRLRQERKALEGEVKSLEDNGLSTSLQSWTSELSVYDNHPADIGDELFERSKDIALRDNEQVILSRIDEALERIDNGSYGICRLCGRPIDQERLEVLPWANDCIHCRRHEDQQNPIGRPLEEERLSPPFYRTFLDHSKHGYTGFDGEDSWQAVARYGTSETPQDIPGAHDYNDLWANSDESAGRVDHMDSVPDSRFRPEDLDKKSDPCHCQKQSQRNK